jgi:sugar lactone lactonase YvrE
MAQEISLLIERTIALSSPIMVTSRVVQWPRRNGKSGETIVSNVTCWSLLKDRDGYLYVSDRDKNEVRRWKIGDMNGSVVGGGNRKGEKTNQFSSPCDLSFDRQNNLYVLDFYNCRVQKFNIDTS